MTTETKTIRAQIKQAGEAGEFEAVIATLGVVDHDGDIVQPGAFGDQNAPIAPAHDAWSVALGKVFRVEERDGEAVAIGQFNRQVQAGRDWHEAVKFDLENPPGVQEWSWGYLPTKFSFEDQDGAQVRILEEINLIEVSPVQRGASIGTRTLSAKSHKTETSGAVWDPMVALRHGDAGEHIAHHFVADGKSGAASTRACILGIAMLNGYNGGIGYGVDKKAAYEHLASHLKDAGIEPPELRPAGAEPGLRLVDQVKFARWQVEAAAERLKQVIDGRRENGRVASEETKAEALLMAAEAEKLHSLLERLDETAHECAPEDQAALAIAAWVGAKAGRV